ncbi:MAG: MMPL family transporter, partial [Bacteroidota bacterium]
TLVVYLKTVENIQLDEAEALMNGVNDLVKKYDFPEHHYLGRAYFQKELIEMQKWEIIFSSVVSGILVTFIMFFIFRRPIGILLALVSIGLGMLLFMGFMGAFGRELNAMAALYPVIMIMVGTSDVVHIMTKYIDELKKGRERKEAAIITVKEIGLATLLTSVTTAIGFASLATSRITPIRDLGINAAIGVMIAYFTVIFFTAVMLSGFKVEQLIKLGKGNRFWDDLMAKSYRMTVSYPRRITWISLGVLVLTFVGIAKITTNYDIINNLPKGEVITEDFIFFEENLTGFRPIEFAVFAQGDYKATDYEVLQEVDKLENHLMTLDALKAVTSITAIYKSINQMYNSNRPEAYVLPKDKKQFERYEKMAARIPQNQANVLLSKDMKKTRLSSRVFDLGADSIKVLGSRIEGWIADNLNEEIVKVKQTGTGLIIDKNAEYVRRNLIQGLGMAIIIVSILMALLFRNWKMLLISLVPNLFPLLMAGSLLGYWGIELEAGVSIVFAAIFGIAVDDTIHFLSKFKLAINKGFDTESALKITFHEAGKAIVLTTIILFFGFLIMLFSKSQPTVVVGALISTTLIGALVSDLMLIPLLIRWLMKKEIDNAIDKNGQRESELEEAIA